jgi:hypothetical protein
VGDVVAFKMNGTPRALELHKLHPESVYHKITSVKNGRISGIPLDAKGKPLATKSQPLKANYWEGRHFSKGNAWTRVNYPENEWAGKSMYSHESTKKTDSAYRADSTKLSFAKLDRCAAKLDRLLA